MLWLPTMGQFTATADAAEREQLTYREFLAELSMAEREDRWVKNGHPLGLIGDSGTGKSHPLIALGTEAAMAGHRVKYVLAARLVNELVEAADDTALTKAIARYGRVDLLCIDEPSPTHDCAPPSSTGSPSTAPSPTLPTLADVPSIGI